MTLRQHSILIHTGLQPGERAQAVEKPFLTVSHVTSRKTVETVSLNFFFPHRAKARCE
jgi:hypothetical protein